MMMEITEAVDGMEYAIWEVDQELTNLMPELGRRACTARVMEEADRLLDIRNHLVSIMGEIVIDDYERMMQNGD